MEPLWVQCEAASQFSPLVKSEKNTKNKPRSYSAIFAVIFVDPKIDKVQIGRLKPTELTL